MAVARLGLTVWEYYQMTPRETAMAFEAHVEKEKQDTQRLYETTRLIAVNVWNAAGNRLKKPIRDPKEFMPFPWESAEQTDLDRALRMWVRTHNKRVEKCRKATI